jgi:sugar-specific transcriptional regulator TrmB
LAAQTKTRKAAPSAAPARTAAAGGNKKTAAGSSKHRDGLAQELQSLGFSEYEARAYMALLESSPATAYEVSKAAGLPRANTYGALESCTEKGAVQPFSQRPIRYIPVDPQDLLSRIADDTAARCKQLASRLGQVSRRKPQLSEHEGEEGQRKDHGMIRGRECVGSRPTRT